MLACFPWQRGALSPLVCLQPTTANTCAYDYHSRSKHRATISLTSTSAPPQVGWHWSCALSGGGQRAVCFWQAGLACLVRWWGGFAGVQTSTAGTCCLQPNPTNTSAHDHHCSAHHNHCPPHDLHCSAHHDHGGSHNHQVTFSPTPAPQVCRCWCTAMLEASPDPLADLAA